MKALFRKEGGEKEEKEDKEGEKKEGEKGEPLSVTCEMGGYWYVEFGSEEEALDALLFIRGKQVLREKEGKRGRERKREKGERKKGKRLKKKKKKKKKTITN